MTGRNVAGDFVFVYFSEPCLDKLNPFSLIIISLNKYVFQHFKTFQLSVLAQYFQIYFCLKVGCFYWDTL